MRRYLVNEFESLRHPARGDTLRSARAEAAKAVAAQQSEPLTDFVFFVLSFVSGFIIFMGMIA